MALRVVEPPPFAAAEGPLADYLYRTAEQLNAAFARTGPAETLGALADAVSADPAREPDPAARESYRRLKSLLVKTADWTLFQSETLTKKLASSYVAAGAFGRYFENASVEIEGSAVGIRQLYRYSAGIRSEFEDFDASRTAYIKTGYLYDDAAGLPVYGVGVGELAAALSQNGKTVLDRRNLFAAFTSDRLSFWQSGAEVAYISAGALHLPSAELTGGTLDIGGGKFRVSALGELTAQSADITGTVHATAGSIGGAVIENGVLRVPAASISGTLAASQISADVITTANWSAQRVSAAMVASDVLTTQNLSAQSLSAGQITSGTLAAERISSGSSWLSGLYAAQANFTTAYSTWFRAASGSFTATYGPSTINGTTGYGTGSYSITLSALASSASDRDVKNSIEPLPEAYDALFDALEPVRYRYNAGSSGRYHTGFVAQQVAEAAAAAGLTLGDLAAVVRFTDEEAAARTDGCRWALRRDELVALNTSQVQRLKRRVAALEQRLAALSD